MLYIPETHFYILYFYHVFDYFCKFEHFYLCLIIIYRVATGPVIICTLRCCIRLRAYVYMLITFRSVAK